MKKTIFGLLLILLALSGCASNPVEGDKPFVRQSQRDYPDAYYQQASDRMDQNLLF